MILQNINKTRTKEDLENSAQCFGGNYLTNNLVKCLQGSLVKCLQDSLEDRIKP